MMMKKKSTSKQQIEKSQKESILLMKIKQEKTLITAEIKSKFETVDTICVDTEFNDVSFDVYREEFDKGKRGFSTERAEFKYERCDESMNTLYFSYTLKT